MSLQLTPDTLRQLELLKLRARRTFLGTRQGGHVSLKRGHGIEFSDFRKYELGDDPRHIDWGVYGRTERLYVKRFQEEQDLSIALILDSSASMFFPENDRKWERTCQLALALAYIGLMQQDRVMLMVPGQLQSGFVSGATAYSKLAAMLAKVSKPEKSDFVESAVKTLGRLSHPGLVVVLSDFLNPLDHIQRLLQGLQSRNLEINAIQVLGPNDLKPYEEVETLIAVDSETGLEVDLTLDSASRRRYEQLLLEHNFYLQKYCGNHAIRFIQCYASQTLHSNLFEQLSKTGLFA